MNKMAEVAKLFDKELEEKFTIIDDNGVVSDACFNEAGVACFPPAVSANVLKKLLTGTYRIKKTPWKAKDDKKYFRVMIKQGEIYPECVYETNPKASNITYNNGFMCKTIKQAEELSKLLIKTARQFQGF